MRQVALALILVGCGSRDYAPCKKSEDCAAPNGVTAECLDASIGGFCSWSCKVDDDCSYDDGVARVCASFESQPGLHCFPACEGDQETCPDGFGCRSTGGGNDNERVCYPDALAGGTAAR